MSARTNVADRLAAVAAQMSDATAVVSARGGRYRTCTFRELNDDATALARGLADRGVKPGDRLVLLVKPGIEFVKLVFALLRSGATAVLVDPGMGRRHLVNCLAATNPDGFIAVSPAQAVRTLLRRRFPNARMNVTVGRRWFWGGAAYPKLLRQGRSSHAELPLTEADGAAAIIFTSGSTGPPKGVLYTHRMFDTQASEIQRAYQLGPGGVDLACFALFGLFNSVWGVTTVFPEMDFSRPASADPAKLLAVAKDWQVTQAFASPAVWDKLSRHCQRTSERISTLRKVFSCGAPVPSSVLERTLAMVHPEAEMHTPYGATEALPIATIAAREVLSETAAKTSDGAGVCVGRRFDTIDWRVVRISDEPIATIDDVEELPAGEIGELIVRGPQVSPRYVNPGWTGRLSDPSVVGGTANWAGADANAHSKVGDAATVWHRMGDVGYLDDQGRFWYCGRKSQRVRTAEGDLFTECVEAVFNRHPRVRRCALVGVGPRCDVPAIVYETASPRASDAAASPDAVHTTPQLAETIPQELVALAAQRALTSGIETFLRHPELPVDVRHNSKINREQLAAWAAEQLTQQPGGCHLGSASGG
ncbi:MAG: peptide synthase [Planctomycetota bacterium]|nr:MAG: peptide synthase [Planctomycetota bacterium]